MAGKCFNVLFFIPFEEIITIPAHIFQLEFDPLYVFTFQFSCTLFLTYLILIPKRPTFSIIFELFV